MVKRDIKKKKEKFGGKGFEITIGVFFLILQLAVIIYQLESKNSVVLYWFCNHILFILGISFIFRKYDLIKAVICVGLIPQIVWAADFFSKIFFGEYLSGMTRYVFESSNLLGVFVPLEIHLMSIFIALLATYRKKTSFQVLIYSSFYIAMIYIFSLLFTPASLNANCVFRPCSFASLMPGNYSLVWPFLVFTLVVAPTFLFQKLLYRIYKKIEF